MKGRGIKCLSLTPCLLPGHTEVGLSGGIAQPTEKASDVERQAEQCLQPDTARLGQGPEGSGGEAWGVESPRGQETCAQQQEGAQRCFPTRRDGTKLPAWHGQMAEVYDGFRLAKCLLC